jgi:lipopolysaccharide heptosyltransferase I
MHSLMHPHAARLADRDRLLIVRLGALGDVLRTLPALHLLHKSFPGLHIAWMVEDLSRPLLEGHPEIDEVIRLPLPELRAAAGRPLALGRGLAELARDLRRRRFTVAADFQGTLKSGLLAWLSGAPRRVGFAPGHCREMSFLLTNRWARPRSRHLNRVAKNLVLAQALGAHDDEVTFVLPESAEEARQAEGLLRSAGAERSPVVLLSPGTSHRQRHKRWPEESFALLAVLMATELGATPLVVWGPGEEDAAGAIVAASGGKALLAPPTGLRLLAAILRRAAAFVGADTGPMHLAWAVGCPVTALFGPTDPRLNAPLGEGHVVLTGAGSTAAISPERVLAAVRGILERSGTPRAASAAPRLSGASLLRAPGGPTP